MTELFWQFKLKGNDWAKQQISIATQAQKGWQIIQLENEWWLRFKEPFPQDAVHISDLEKENRVEGIFRKLREQKNKAIQQASDIVTRLNSVLFFIDPSAGSLSLSDILYLDGQERLAFLEVIETLQMSDHIGITTFDPSGQIVEQQPADKIRSFLVQMEQSPNIAEMMQYIQQYNINSWDGLYKIYEQLRKKMKNDDNLIQKLGTSKKERDRFTRTANHPGASGDLARHAVDKNPPPKNPLTLEQGRDYIKNLLLRYFGLEIQANPPTQEKTGKEAMPENSKLKAKKNKDNKSFALLDTLTIHHFKSIVDQKIELGLINVFIGANGSGKSNVLEALGVLSSAASGRVDDESLIRRGVRPGVPRLYKAAFKDLNNEVDSDLYFEAHHKDTMYSVMLHSPQDSPQSDWQFNDETLKSGKITFLRRAVNEEINLNNEQGLAALESIKLNESEPASQLLNTLRDYAIYSPNTQTLRGASDAQTRPPLGLSGGRLADAVKELKKHAKKSEFLSEAFEELLELIDWVDDIDTSTSADNLSPSISRPKLVLNFKDRFMSTKKNNNVLTAYDASEGALYVLFAALLALLPNSPACFAIDNLDQALNPRLIQALVEKICRWTLDNPVPRQMLFTAHNPLLLDGLPLQDERVRLFTVDRNNKGHTIIKRILITPELINLSKENGWPLSRLWVMGHLGGVPNV